MIKTHRFDSTGDAYDASQTDESISNGDVLVVESERVVGVLVDAWPVAVTPEHGAFHTFAPDVDVSAFGAEPERTLTYTVHPRKYIVRVGGVDVSEHDGKIYAEDAAHAAHGSVVTVELEPYEHTETIAAKPARDLRPSVDVALAIADALWGELNPDDDPAHARLVPTGEAKTSDGVALLDAFPVGSRVAFVFPPDYEHRDGLVGEGTIVGVLEHVVDDGDGESGPHLSVYVVLGLWHDGTLHSCHPEDGDTLSVIA
jgi:hypothetical protein